MDAQSEIAQHTHQVDAKLLIINEPRYFAALTRPLVHFLAKGSVFLLSSLSQAFFKWQIALCLEKRPMSFAKQHHNISVMTRPYWYFLHATLANFFPKVIRLVTGGQYYFPYLIRAGQRGKTLTE